MENTNKLKRRKIVLIIFLIIAFLIVVADLTLFATSLRDTGTGRGFSRYWRE